MSTIGFTVWVIPGGRMPLTSTGREPDYTSCDELCVLNATQSVAALKVTVFFEDQAPVHPYEIEVAAQRIRHLRMNDLIDPQAIPLDRPYGVLIESNIPIVVQFSRRDTSQAANAIATMLGFPVQ
jgi:hypothetical protein